MAVQREPGTWPPVTDRPDADPAGLGRGPLTRWLPVLGQAPAEPPNMRPFEVGSRDTAGRFLARVIFSVPRITVPTMGLAIIWQVGESAVPVVMGVAIDRALATGSASQLMIWIGALIALYLALTVAARLTNRLNVHTLQLLQHRLRATLSVRILHPVGEAARPPDAGVVSTMTNDVTRLANAGLLLTLSISRIAAIGFIAVSLLAAHWVLGVAVLAGAPVVVWLLGLLSRRLSHDTRTYQDLLAATVGRAADLVAGYRVIKGMHAETEATRRYRQASQETLAGAKRNAGLLGRFQAVSGALNATFVAAVTGLAGWFAVSHQLSVGELITTVGLTQALLPQIQGIASTSIPNLASARACCARILDALTGTPTTAPGARSARSCGHAIPTLAVHLPGATIRVAPGELVGVRADDRTAARIADTLLRPEADHDITVCLDGHPAGEVAHADYHARVVVAPHRTTLFTGTIGDNLSSPTSTPELVAAAVQAAACADFATSLDLPVGENGNRLSGGQRQRVALARALATDAPVLVLHDPTTAIDSVTEHAIAIRLRGVREGRSTLLIASSPALLARCDRVVDLPADKAGSDKAVSDKAGVR